MTLLRTPVRATAAALMLGLCALGAQASDPAAPPPPPDMHGFPAGPMGPGPMHGPLVLHHAAELGLSPEQVDTVKGIYRNAHPAIEQLHQQIHAQMQALTQTKPGDANYAGIVAKAAQSIGDLTSQAIVQESQVRTQVWNALTAPQRDKLAALEAQAHARGPGPGFGPPPPGN